MKFVALLVLMFSLCCHAGTNGLYADSLSWTGRVYLAILGDSIAAGDGAQNYNAFGLGISNASGNQLRITNVSYSGSSWSNATPVMDMLYQLSKALTNTPRWVFIQCGRNNLTDCFITNQAYPCVWPMISARLDTINATCQSAGVRIVLGEILPAYDTNSHPTGEWSVPGIHLLNAAYANWCLTNVNSANTKISIQHDAFGVWCPPRSGYDWLNDAYRYTDGLHITQPGYDMWGPLLVNTLGGFFTDPTIINASVVRVGTLRTQ